MYPKELVRLRDQKKQQKDKKKQDETLMEKGFFNVHFLQRIDIPDVIFLDKLEFLVQTMVLQMDDEFIGYVFKFTSTITDYLNTNITGVHEIFTSNNIKYGDNWSDYQSGTNDNGLFRILESNNEDWSEEDSNHDNGDSEEKSN